MRRDLLILGAQAPPLRTFREKRDPYIVAYASRPIIPQGVDNYVLQTQALQVQTTSAGGVQFNSGAMLGYGQRPFVAQPTVTLSPMPTFAGRVQPAPLSSNPNDPV